MYLSPVPFCLFSLVCFGVILFGFLCVYMCGHLGIFLTRMNVFSHSFLLFCPLVWVVEGFTECVTSRICIALSYRVRMFWPSETAEASNAYFFSHLVSCVYHSPSHFLDSFLIICHFMTLHDVFISLFVSLPLLCICSQLCGKSSSWQSGYSRSQTFECKMSIWVNLV